MLPVEPRSRKASLEADKSCAVCRVLSWALLQLHILGIAAAISWMQGRSPQHLRCTQLSCPLGAARGEASYQTVQTFQKALLWPCGMQAGVPEVGVTVRH